MGQFDNINLGGDATMRRMIQRILDERRKVINECADCLDRANMPDAAALVRALLSTKA